MSDAEDIFATVCRAKDTLAAVAGLSAYELRLLYGYLATDYSENGITGKVLGVVMVEATERWMAGNTPKK